MASHCTFPTTPLITSHKPPIIFPNYPSPIPLPLLKSHRPKFPTLSAAAQPPPTPPRAISTVGAPVLEEGSGLPDRWQEIMGKNDWDGLLDPMDPLLRLELLKYGDFSACTYEAFIDDIYARNYGACKFESIDFFDHMLMPKHGYNVTQFIHCTSSNDWWPFFLPKPINPQTWKETNIWMGFIAVSDDATSKLLGRRDICITWRGTITKMEWEDDALAYLVHLPGDMPSPKSDVKVEKGFLSLYTQKDSVDSSARTLVLDEVKRLVNEVYPNEELSITVTGHSLGAALAVLNAYDIVESGANVGSAGKVPVCAMTYAGPRVGNPDFKDRVDELGVKVLRVVNVADVVPLVPGVFGLQKDVPEIIVRGLNDLGYHLAYLHVGVKLELDMDNSPYLKGPSVMPTTDLSDAHDLELYLHLVDGYQGKDKKFELATGRDLAFLNKYCDLLKEDHLVPPSWRVELNKSMVPYKGFWVHESTINYFPDGSL